MKQIISNLISKVKKPESKKSKKSKEITKKEKTIKIAAIAVAVLLLVGIPIYLFIKNPSALIVAKVENTYITRRELNEVLTKAYGTQALEDLAYKRLADMEFKKKNIVVSEEEMNVKILEIEQSLGGMSLDEALSSSGMTREDLESNIRLQVSLEKLLSDSIVVTSEEVSAYVTENAEQLAELSEEEKNGYASEQLKQQKLQIEMGKWFEELRQDANIKFYL